MKDKYLTEADIDRIAEQPAKRALEKVYSEVGKSVRKKVSWLVGAVALGLAMWLIGNGNFPKG